MFRYTLPYLIRKTYNKIKHNIYGLQNTTIYFRESKTIRG